MMELKIKLLNEFAKAPTKAHEEDACFDIYNSETEEVRVPPHDTYAIHTGFATEIPHGYWGAIFARSGIALKRGLRPAQGVPVIDENYRGEWLIPLHNDTDEWQSVNPGERIAQFTLLPYPDINIRLANDLNDTDRGEGGFGSSGK